MMDDELEAAKKKSQELLDIPGVSGVGVKKKSNPGNHIRVYVEDVTPEIKAALPEKIDGFPVEIVKSGRIKLFDTIPRSGRYRPAGGGISVGHPKITAGTLGAIVYDSVTREALILSNSHVIAPPGLCVAGDVILQPGVYDGGIYDDAIAYLRRWFPIYQGTANLVDCAVATPIDPDDVTPVIMGIGTPSEDVVLEPKEGIEVRKSGRTTGVTSGTVIDTDATINVYLDDDSPVKFSDQIITSHMADPGDSGSLLVDGQDRPVGLVFAGSENLTVANKITHVMAALGVDFGRQYDLAVPEQAKFNIGIPILAGIFIASFVFMLRK